MTTFPESHQDLLQTDVAVLATLGPDGFPQVSAVWFVLDEGTLTLSINTGRQKARNLERHPECTLFLIAPGNPYHTMEIRARADVAPDTDDAIVRMVGEKYNANVRDHDAPGQSRLAITLHPVKINTYG